MFHTILSQLVDKSIGNNAEGYKHCLLKACMSILLKDLFMVSHACLSGYYMNFSDVLRL